MLKLVGSETGTPGYQKFMEGLFNIPPQRAAGIARRYFDTLSIPKGSYDHHAFKTVFGTHDPEVIERHLDEVLRFLAPTPIREVYTARPEVQLPVDYVNGFLLPDYNNKLEALSELSLYERELPQDHVDRIVAEAIREILPEMPGCSQLYQGYVASALETQLLVDLLHRSDERRLVQLYLTDLRDLTQSERAQNFELEFINWIFREQLEILTPLHCFEAPAGGDEFGRVTPFIAGWQTSGGASKHHHIMPSLVGDDMVNFYLKTQGLMKLHRTYLEQLAFSEPGVDRNALKPLFARFEQPESGKRRVVLGDNDVAQILSSAGIYPCSEQGRKIRAAATAIQGALARGKYGFALREQHWLDLVESQQITHRYGIDEAEVFDFANRKRELTMGAQSAIEGGAKVEVMFHLNPGSAQDIGVFKRRIEWALWEFGPHNIACFKLKDCPASQGPEYYHQAMLAFSKTCEELGVHTIIPLGLHDHNIPADRLRCGLAAARAMHPDQRFRFDVCMTDGINAQPATKTVLRALMGSPFAPGTPLYENWEDRERFDALNNAVVGRLRQEREQGLIPKVPTLEAAESMKLGLQAGGAAVSNRADALFAFVSKLAPQLGIAAFKPDASKWKRESDLTAEGAKLLDAFVATAQARQGVLHNLVGSPGMVTPAMNHIAFAAFTDLAEACANGTVLYTKEGFVSKQGKVPFAKRPITKLTDDLANWLLELAQDPELFAEFPHANRKVMRMAFRGFKGWVPLKRVDRAIPLDQDTPIDMEMLEDALQELFWIRELLGRNFVDLQVLRVLKDKELKEAVNNCTLTREQVAEHFGDRFLMTVEQFEVDSLKSVARPLTNEDFVLIPVEGEAEPVPVPLITESTLEIISKFDALGAAYGDTLRRWARIVEANLPGEDGADPRKLEKALKALGQMVELPR